MLVWRQLTGTASALLKALLAAWAFFCVALAPALGFTDTGLMRFALVADQYQYIAIIGVVALAAAALSVCLQRLGPTWQPLIRVATVTIVIVCMIQSWRLSKLYGDPIEMYQVNLRKDPASWVSHVNLAKTYQRQEKFPEAIAHFRQALVLRPQKYEVRILIGSMLDKMGRYTEAIDEDRKVLEANPEDPSAHNNLGIVLEEIGQREPAIAQYQLAVNELPDFGEAQYNLALALIHLGKPQEALEHFERVRELDPTDMEAAMSTALTLAQLGRTSEAISAAEDALQLAHRQGKTREAEQIEAWLKTHPPTMTH